MVILIAPVESLYVIPVLPLSNPLMNAPSLSVSIGCPPIVALSVSNNPVTKVPLPSDSTYHLSAVSFHWIDFVFWLPRFTSIPALVLGVPVTLEFNVIILSSTDRVAVLTSVLVPATTKLPLTVKLLVTVNPENVLESPVRLIAPVLLL